MSTTEGSDGQLDLGMESDVAPGRSSGSALVRRNEGDVSIVSTEALLALAQAGPTESAFLRYLQDLRAHKPRTTMVSAARTLLSCLQDAPAYAHLDLDPTLFNLVTFPWGNLRDQHTSYIRAELLRRGFSARSINKDLICLRQIVKRACLLGQTTYEDCHRAVDPMVLKRVPEHPTTAGRHLSDAEVFQLFTATAAVQHAGGRLDAALIAVVFGLGLRRDEAAHLTMDDYNPVEVEFRVMKGKGDKPRLVPLRTRERLQPVIDDWLCVRGTHPGRFFLTVNKGGVISRKGFSGTGAGILTRLQVLARSANVPPFQVVDGRRTCLGELLSSGVDISLVAKFAGHKSVMTTQVYDRRPHQALRNAVNPSSVQVPIEAAAPICGDCRAALAEAGWSIVPPLTPVPMPLTLGL